jgi:hypothetical protein
MADLGRAGKLNTPEYRKLESTFNQIGDVLVRLRNAVATVIVRNQNGPGLWKSIAAKLPSIQYNLNESLGGASGMAQYRNLPGTDSIGVEPTQPVKYTMRSTFLEWTGPEADTIGAALPAQFVEWVTDLVAAFWYCGFLIRTMMYGPPSGGEVVSSFAAQTGTPSAKGSEASNARHWRQLELSMVAVVIAGGLWLFRRRNQRRKS